MTEVTKVDKWPDNDVWAKERKAWDDMTPAQREAFYREHADAIDRWQAETDAMAEDDTDEKKE